MQMSEAAYTRARDYLLTHGRPLDVARWRFHFDNAPAEPVLEALSAYQNPDGGFGHALEPDLRIAESSALCTSVAFQILREVQPNHPDSAMTSRAIAYLLDTLDPELKSWAIIPRSALGKPGAPWWSQRGDDSFTTFTLNPTAELLGYLHDHRDQVPAGLLASLTETVMTRLEAAESLEMHELFCAKRLMETSRLDQGLKDRLRDRLLPIADRIVCRDPSQWVNYTLRPVQIADRPDSPFLKVLQESVEANLDYEIASQGEDGAWPANWSWGGLFPEVWEQAKREWRSVIALDKLLLLKRFGRLAGSCTNAAM